MKIISIDPGKSGGIAWLDGAETGCQPMPSTLGDLVDTLRSFAARGFTEAYLEQVVGFIPKAGAGAMFSFGQGFGQIQGVLAALSFRVIEVRPAKWQKELSCGAKKDYPGSEWKRHLRSMAQSRFPTCDVTLKTADALLLLDFSRQIKTKTD